MVGPGHYEVRHSKSGKAVEARSVTPLHFDLRSEFKLVNRKFDVLLLKTK